MIQLRRQDTLDDTNLPQDCIDDCSQPGSVDEFVEFWVDKLEFMVNPQDGLHYLTKEVGLPEEDFITEGWGIDSDRVNQYVLWIACNQIKEQGLFVLGV